MQRVPETIQPTQFRKVPAYCLLNETDLDRLEDQADWLLEKIGMEFCGDAEAIDRLAAAGARVDGQRVRFKDGLARALCSTAPPTA